MLDNIPGIYRNGGQKVNETYQKSLTLRKVTPGSPVIDRADLAKVVKPRDPRLDDLVTDEDPGDRVIEKHKKPGERGVEREGEKVKALRQVITDVQKGIDKANQAHKSAADPDVPALIKVPAPVVINFPNVRTRKEERAQAKGEELLVSHGGGFFSKFLSPWI